MTAGTAATLSAPAFSRLPTRLAPIELLRAAFAHLRKPAWLYGLPNVMRILYPQAGRKR